MALPILFGALIGGAVGGAAGSFLARKEKGKKKTKVKDDEIDILGDHDTVTDEEGTVYVILDEFPVVLMEDGTHKLPGRNGLRANAVAQKVVPVAEFEYYDADDDDEDDYNVCYLYTKTG